jgi:hypothetical protein
MERERRTGLESVRQQDHVEEVQHIRRRKEKQKQAEFSLHVSEKPAPYSGLLLVDAETENSSASHIPVNKFGGKILSYRIDRLGKHNYPGGL